MSSSHVANRVRTSSFGSATPRGGGGDGASASATRYAGLLATATRRDPNASPAHPLGSSSSSRGDGQAVDESATSTRSRLAVLEGELRAYRQQAADLTQLIGEKNDGYIRREEELCDRISDLNKNATQREKAAPSVAEQRVLAERFRRASQLQQDIMSAEARLADGEQERALAETAAHRLEQHIRAAEDAAAPLAHALEGLVATMRGICSDALVSSPAEVSRCSGGGSGGGDAASLQHHPNTGATSAVHSAAASASSPPPPSVPLNPPHLLQDAVVDRVPAVFRERCAMQLATRVIAGHVEWFAQQLGRVLAEEGATQATRVSDAVSRHQEAREKLTANASLLEASQGALLETHNNVLERRRYMEQRAELLSTLEAQLAQARAAVPPSLQQASAVEAAMMKIEGELTSLSLDAAREAERVALQQTETSLAAARAQQSQASLDEATEVLEQRKRALKEMEQEKSDLARKLFLLEEAKASGEQRINRLSSELASTQESLQTTEARLATASADDDASVKAWRVLERELDGLRALDESAHRRYEAKASEKARLEEEYRRLREDRSLLRQQILDAQSSLTATLTKEQDAIQELQYVQRLLPKNHPSAKLSRKLQARVRLGSGTDGEGTGVGPRGNGGEEDEEEERRLTSIAVAKRSELLDSARKSLQQRTTLQQQQYGSSAAASSSSEPVVVGNRSPPPRHNLALDFDASSSDAHDMRMGATVAAGPQPSHSTQPPPPRSTQDVAQSWLPAGHRVAVDHPLSSEPLLHHSSTIPLLDPTAASRELSSSVQSTTSIGSRGAAATSTTIGDDAPSFGWQQHRTDLQQQRTQSYTAHRDNDEPSISGDDGHRLKRPSTQQQQQQQQQHAAVDQRSVSGTSSSTHTSSIAEINEKLNEIMNRRRR